MFLSIDYLINGNPRQQKAYHTLSRLNIMEDLREFNPILCGTIPIGIDIKDSDLDIIIEVRDFQYFENMIRNLYGLKYNFKISHSIIRDIPVITVNFNFEEFEIEIFGQATPVQKQNAYIHMVIEHLIMEQFPNIRSEVIHLKEQGYKTEPAFCKILGLEGDPYDSLIEYGKKMFNVK
ncbi:DUF4269 domain-containing protein [Gottfriedia solisilvae]|uniref:Alpha/beta hydrolase n=1 Tax=Gottfriedia solisilvae TaxID=1516104 RepID=A0A8J3AS64_9BACI|nr:DUF4269 domain-containing protein [Gottfriedia solisilvae]GGI15228.1 alpha/beta hydrolase [Gottfriedia solisilvae]